MTSKTKKYSLLVALFFMPILALLFFLKAQYNFKPVDAFEVSMLELPKNESDVVLKKNINIVSFLGYDVLNNKNVFFNLNQKINKRFKVYKHLKLVVVTLSQNKASVTKILNELQQTANADIDKWEIIYLDEADYKNFYNSFNVGIALDDNLNAPLTFLLDEQLVLRGRKDDKDNGVMLGYNANDVSQVNKLKDDVKMLLKEFSVHNNENKANRTSNIKLEDEK